MRIGIGLGHGPDAARAAADAARQASRGAPRPDLSIAFGGIRLDQRRVHRALASELDASRLVGGSSYGEITGAGVSAGSVAVLNLSFAGASPRFAQAQVGADAAAAGRRLGRGLRAAGAPGPRSLGFYFGSVFSGRDNEALGVMREELGPVPLFGGMTCGDYDLGISHPEFWTNFQYGPTLTRRAARAALVDLPEGFTAAFGFEHGWHPVGPPVVVTRARGERVYEVDGMPVFDYYRQFLGEEREDRFFEKLVQRYGFSVLQPDGRSVVKVPVICDRRRGFMSYFPSEPLQGARVRLILASRHGLVAGARAAAESCRRALRGRKPDLLLAVSCCTRKKILNSRVDRELEAVRGVFGADVPVFGFYSSGEIGPFESRWEDACSPEKAGSRYHTTTVTLLALASPARARPSVPRPASPAAGGAGKAMEQLEASEEALDHAESFFAELTRKSYEDGEKLRRQSDVIRRYTPHGVWSAVGARAARGLYEVPDASFTGAFLFMDVKGFTSFSETRAPDEVVRELNALLSPAADAVYACGGDVDKFIGDCIFAVFPSADDALAAARRMLALAAERRRAGSPFDVRVGVNWGRAVRANVGSDARREYTFIGDAVNLAQRLESNASPGRVLVSAAAWRRLKSRPSGAARRRITVKGKSKPVSAFELGL